MLCRLSPVRNSQTSDKDLLFYQERVFASPGAEEALALASARECAAEGRCTDTSTLRRADDVPRSPPTPDANAQRYAIVRD